MRIGDHLNLIYVGRYPHFNIRVEGKCAGARNRCNTILDPIAVPHSNDTARLEPLALPEIFATIEARLLFKNPFSYAIVIPSRLRITIQYSVVFSTICVKVM